MEGNVIFMFLENSYRTVLFEVVEPLLVPLDNLVTLILAGLPLRLYFRDV